MQNLQAKMYIVRFGEHLKFLRSKRKLTQQELSLKTGVSISHISRMERGVRSPTVDVLFSLSKGLNTHPMRMLEFKYKKRGG
jgi:transcriptional regulator with XRE-family HTH domain